MKYLRLTAILPLATSLFVLGGCASIISGSHQEVSFNSNPDGATVTVAGKILGKTPFTISLKKQSNQAIVFSKDGYKPITMQLETRINGWFWGNIVLGGFFGSTTDGLSGAVHEYSPGQYMVTLQPDGTGPAESHTALGVKQKAKDYIVVAYKDIIGELAKGGKGKYMDSLFELLKIPADDKAEAEAIQKIKALSEAYTNIPEFADHVVDLYLK